MGIVFGITGCEEPAYHILKRAASYEIRQYQPYCIAEVTKNEFGDDQSFRLLAKYIGVFGDPANTKREAMAMTAPVISEGMKLQMTSPVTSSDETMAFVMPFNFKSLDQLPQPTDPRVKLRLIPSRVIATKWFTGWYSADTGKSKYEELKGELSRDGFEAPSKWTVAQFHPPFTIPFLRKNEIWIELDDKRDEIRKIVDQLEKEGAATK